MLLLLEVIMRIVARLSSVLLAAGVSHAAYGGCFMVVAGEGGEEVREVGKSGDIYTFSGTIECRIQTRGSTPQFSEVIAERMVRALDLDLPKNKTQITLGGWNGDRAQVEFYDWIQVGRLSGTIGLNLIGYMDVRPNAMNLTVDFSRSHDIGSIEATSYCANTQDVQFEFEYWVEGSTIVINLTKEVSLKKPWGTMGRFAPGAKDGIKGDLMRRGPRHVDAIKAAMLI